MKEILPRRRDKQDRIQAQGGAPKSEDEPHLSNDAVLYHNFLCFRHTMHKQEAAYMQNNEKISTVPDGIWEGTPSKQSSGKPGSLTADLQNNGYPIPPESKSGKKEPDGE